uniref:DNA binding protein VP5 n=1 Tax=Gokushovirinae environmental samples TaxID=1478972 RepID=A0A2R3UAF6_9VIRU|nr:DNA binding protein VP5 [Gokushovirinae environmental samples]
MRINAYSVFDRKTLAYHMPFYAPTDGAAVRTLADATADPNTSLGRHPNDYVLFEVGYFDDAAGALVATSPVRHIIDVIALVKATQAEIPFPETLQEKNKAYPRPNGEAA